MRTVDAVVIGSGHNSLVAAAYLARAGWSVEVLERNEHLGGAIATEELTCPGFLHDTFSSWHPLFTGSATYAELGSELEARGLRYLNTDVPTAVAHSHGSLLAFREPEETAAQFGEDSHAFLRELAGFSNIADLVGQLLGTELRDRRAATIALRLMRRVGWRGSFELIASSLRSADAWLERTFTGPEVGLLYAPWILHTGLSPASAGGGLQLVALAAGLHIGGMPVAEGGSRQFVGAFERLIEDHGGTLRTGVDVERITVRRGRAVGVVAQGEEIAAAKAVIANVTPTQLYRRLLPDGGPTRVDEARAEAAGYTYGRAGLQIHLALTEPLEWRDSRLRDAAIVHIADGPRPVALACAEAASGLLPRTPTVVCGQPTVIDPSRAPEGRSILWVQLQEVPYAPVGDAAGEIAVDGGWDERLADAYAERVIARIAEHAPNLPSAILGRSVLTPLDLERRNVNLRQGDPYSGATDLHQSYLWRPLPSFGSHRTPVERLWQIGASTHPGPGLNAASGRLAAKLLLRQRP